MLYLSFVIYSAPRSPATFSCLQHVKRSWAFPFKLNLVLKAVAAFFSEKIPEGVPTSRIRSLLKLRVLFGKASFTVVYLRKEETLSSILVNGLEREYETTQLLPRSGVFIV